jgi:hypothetical protein
MLAGRLKLVRRIKRGRPLSAGRQNHVQHGVNLLGRMGQPTGGQAVGYKPSTPGELV